MSLPSSQFLTCLAGLQWLPWICWSEWREGRKGEPQNSLFSVLLKTCTLGHCGLSCVADELSADVLSVVENIESQDGQSILREDIIKFLFKISLVSFVRSAK